MKDSFLYSYIPARPRKKVPASSCSEPTPVPLGHSETRVRVCVRAFVSDEGQLSRGRRRVNVTSSSCALDFSKGFLRWIINRAGLGCARACV